jgi:low temperature requirement protein LtrA
MLAILGDMLFFALLMASTLWLHGILGDGTWATVAIMVVMIGVPYVIKRSGRKTGRQSPVEAPSPDREG